MIYAAIFDGSRYWLAGVPAVRTMGYKYGVRFADYGQKRECEQSVWFLGFARLFAEKLCFSVDCINVSRLCRRSEAEPQR